MHRCIAVFLLSINCWVGCKTANATHLDGGGISYTRLFGNTYSIRMLLYEDCSNGGQSPFHPLSTFTTAFVRNRCGSVPVSLTLNRLPNPVVLPNRCGNVLNSCNGGMTKGVRAHFFEGSYTFPYFNNSLCNEWDISWGLNADDGVCCHSTNFSLSNVPNSPGTGQLNFFLRAYLNNAIDNGNNSGMLELQHAPFFCGNWPVLFNVEQGEPDGDSLVYSLVAPYTSFSTVANYQPGLSPSQPLQNLIDSVRVDQNTGNISFKSGNYHLANLVLQRSEYRGVQLVGTIQLVMRLNLTGGFCEPIRDTSHFQGCDSVTLPDGRVFYQSILIADTIPSLQACDTLHFWDVRVESPSAGGISGQSWAIPGSTTVFHV